MTRDRETPNSELVMAQAAYADLLGQWDDARSALDAARAVAGIWAGDSGLAQHRHLANVAAAQGVLHTISADLLAAEAAYTGRLLGRLPASPQFTVRLLTLIWTVPPVLATLAKALGSDHTLRAALVTTLVGMPRTGGVCALLALFAGHDPAAGVRRAAGERRVH